MKSLGQLLILVAKTKSPQKHVLKQAVDSIRVHGITSLYDYLMQERLEESTEVKWIKTLYHMKTGMDFTKSGLTTSPLRSEIREVRKRLFKSNPNSSVAFYYGRETVNFKMGEMCGSFTRSDQQLVALNVKFVDVNLFTDLLVQIAHYLRFRYEATADQNPNIKTMGHLRNVVEIHVRKEPGIIVGLGPKAKVMQAISTQGIPCIWGCANLEKEGEYMSGEPINLEFDSRYSLVDPST